MDNMNTSCFPLALAALKSAKSANERIDNLPLPMVFKGTLGAGGTISTLPTPSSDNVGFVYIVITDGTYSGQTAKAGDLFVSDGTSWVLVPSGDEPPLIKLFTYTGNGNANNTITFPEKPTYIFSIQGSTSGATWFVSNSIIYGVTPRFIASGMSTVGSQATWYIKGVSFDGNDMTITSSSAGGSFNEDGYTYYIYYI